MINELFVYQFMFDDTTVGFYMLNPPKEKAIELEMLFVLPDFIGKGIGKQLLVHAVQKAKKIRSEIHNSSIRPKCGCFLSITEFCNY